MRRIWTPLIMLLFNVLCITAQDVIYKVSGDSMKVIITSVKNNKIHYYYYDDEQKTSFSIKSDKIQQILFSNGKRTQYNVPIEAISQPQQPIVEPLVSKSSSTEQSTIGKNDTQNISITSSVANDFYKNDDGISENNKNGHAKTEVNQFSSVTNIENTQPKYIQQENNGLAQVLNTNGVLVFSYATPIADYEVIGQVAYSSKSKSRGFWGVFSGGMTIVATSTSDAKDSQYTEIRNGLIANAILSNREVEGIIITYVGDEEGTANIIRFKDKSQRIDLARVDERRGMYLFVDSKPLSHYTYLGTKKFYGLGNSNDIINRLVKKGFKKWKSVAEGIILYYVTGGYDYAEIVSFK